MKAADVMKAHSLILARGELVSFLKGHYNDPGSVEASKELENRSDYEDATVVRVVLVDAKDYHVDGGDDEDEVFSVRLPKSVVMRALDFELVRVERELSDMQIEL